MLIRKNSKEFKKIALLFEELKDSNDRKDKIKLYIVKAGERIDNKVAIDELQQAEDFYYNLTYDTILNNLHDKNHQLHKDENTNIYFFHNSSNKDWDETPFELTEPGSIIIKPATTVSKKPVKKVIEKKKNQLLKKETSVKQRLPISRKGIIEKEKEKEKEKIEQKQEQMQHEEGHLRVHLDHPLEFHYLVKVVFPEKKISKQDILEYYFSMSDHIMPYLQDRPQFFRWHWGSIKESNYNKSLRSLIRDWKHPIPEWIERKAIYAKKYDEEVEYLICKDRDHLMFLIEVGCVEVSPWHSRIGNIENPDYLIIDLDPIDVSFNAVIETAQIVKEVLDATQLPSVIKTSGSKGMHIYIPLDGESDYEESKSLAELLCKLIYKTAPQLTSLERNPQQRSGKVYLDYIQNALAKSIVAPYSLRPNPQAMVATPLAWEEVKIGLKPEEFNYFTIRERVRKKGDLFKKVLFKGINARDTLRILKKAYAFLL